VKFRSPNTPRSAQIEQHAVERASALRAVEATYADRDADGDAFQRLRASLYEHAVAAADEKAVPERDLGSLQSVRAFRRLTTSDICHPDMKELLDSDDLNEVVAEARDVAVCSPDSPHFDYIENSQYQGLVGFQNDAQAKALGAYMVKLDARAKKRLKRAAAAGHKVDISIAPAIDADEAAKAMAEREKWKEFRRNRAKIICDRWDYGFMQEGSLEVAGEIVQPFSEFFGKGVLRSHLDPALACFVWLLPKAGLLRVGMDKAVLLTTTSKILALDAPYVELDPKRLGMVVVELDTVWKTAEALREALLTILPPKMMPQIIVYRTTRSGQVSRPHLIWLLNPKHVDADGVERCGTVWNNPVRTITEPSGSERVVGNPKCQKKPIRKFYAVQRSMVALLAKLGADPACHNVNRPKNPVSPYMTSICANNDYWPILDDFETIPGYQRRVDEEALEEMAAKLRMEATGVEPSTSNIAWKLVGNIIKPLARLALKTRDADFLLAGRSVETLTAWFDAQVRPQVEAELEPSEALDYVLRRRCRFAANWCRNAKPGRRVRRGRDRDLITATVDDGAGGQRNLTVEERATAAAERTNAFRHNKPMWRMCQELTVACRLDGTVDKTAFIKTVGQVSDSFAYKHWEEACRMCGLEETDVAGRFRRAAPKIKRSDYLGSSINLPLPSEDQQASIPTFPGQPTTDSGQQPQRSTVNPPDSSGPPYPPWQTDATSSADPRQRPVEACLESA
jgi:hypothetical protein